MVSLFSIKSIRVGLEPKDMNGSVTEKFNKTMGVVRRGTPALALSLWVAVNGCTRGPLVEVTLVDERTALENQILGTYEELDQEMLLIASVRYIDPKGKLRKSPPLPPGKKKVISAMQRSAFNRDDVDALKAQGLVGENNQGRLELIAPEEVDPNRLPFVENLVVEENEDREVVMRRVIETNESLSDDDLPGVRNIFAALNRDKAKVGEWVQIDNDEWVRKEAN